MQRTDLTHPPDGLEWPAEWRDLDCLTSCPFRWEDDDDRPDTLTRLLAWFIGLALLTLVVVHVLRVTGVLQWLDGVR